MPELRLDPGTSRCPTCRNDILERKSTLGCAQDTSLPLPPRAASRLTSMTFLRPRTFFPPSLCEESPFGWGSCRARGAEISDAEHRWIWFKQQLRHCCSSQSAHRLRGADLQRQKLQTGRIQWQFLRGTAKEPFLRTCLGSTAPLPRFEVQPLRDRLATVPVSPATQ